MEQNPYESPRTVGSFEPELPAPHELDGRLSFASVMLAAIGFCLSLLLAFAIVAASIIQVAGF